MRRGRGRAGCGVRDEADRCLMRACWRMLQWWLAAGLVLQRAGPGAGWVLHPSCLLLAVLRGPHWRCVRTGAVVLLRAMRLARCSTGPSLPCNLPHPGLPPCRAPAAAPLCAAVPLCHCRAVLGWAGCQRCACPASILEGLQHPGALPAHPWPLRHAPMAPHCHATHSPGYHISRAARTTTGRRPALAGRVAARLDTPTPRMWMAADIVAVLDVLRKCGTASRWPVWPPVSGVFTAQPNWR